MVTTLHSYSFHKSCSFQLFLLELAADSVSGVMEHRAAMCSTTEWNTLPNMCNILGVREMVKNILEHTTWLK